jgi:tellurite resistance protein
MLELTDNHPIHLKNFKDPIFIFASSGDNITPPPQALNWIVKVYGSVREIKRQGQVIVYMVHEEIGHLGIFVSGKVAAKEHREIISCLDMLEFLVPGLYEMVITENASNPDVGDYCVHFEARDTKDILELDDGLEDQEAFESVAAVSQVNEAAYRLWVRPWVRMMTNPWMAEASRQMHPLRMQRYLWSDLNPWSWPVAWGADPIRAQRQPARADNPFVELETFTSRMIVAALDAYRDTRDLTQEWLFKTFYDHTWMKSWWHEAPDDLDASTDKTVRRRERARARRLADQGGFAEAVVRITIAVTGVDRILDKRELTRARTIYQSHPQYQQLELAELRQMVNTQAHILAVDYQRALDGLAVMLPGRRERKEAFKIAEKIAVADEGVSADERQVLAAIRSRLNLDRG